MEGKELLKSSQEEENTDKPMETGTLVLKDTPKDKESQEGKIISSTESVNIDKAIKVCTTVLPFCMIMYILPLTVSFNRL